MDSNARFTSVDAYIAAFPAAVQERLRAIRQVIWEEAPDAREVIKYNMPTYVEGGNMVFFSAFKNHISVYPLTDALETALPEVMPYKSGRGTLQFSMAEPLPLDLIRRVVAFRVREMASK